MDNTLSALVTLVKNLQAKIYAWVVIIAGLDPDGNPQALQVDASGNLKTTGGGGGGGDATAANQTTQITQGYGATNLLTSEVVSSGSPQTAAIARPTRKSIFFRNDGTGSDVVRIGEATVSSSKGVSLTAGQGIPFTYVGLFQVIATSGTPTITISDEYY